LNFKPESRQADPTLLLDVDRISILYDRIQATWDISFSVKEHGVTALVGSNGAGKTAIMKAISGVISHAQGRIFFQNQIIDKTPPHRRVQLGISLVPEGRKIFPYLTVKENLEIGAYNHRARKRLEKTIEEVYVIFPVLASRKNQIAGSLSGGEQQMLAIGRGLMSRPKLLMLDEPSLGLAPLLVKRVFKVIERISAEGVTILLVEQNVSQTLQHAQMAYILETGHITLHGKGFDLLKDPHIKKAYMGL
jgi:branched-chain amino acid transport system ATP-binding protein